MIWDRFDDAMRDLDRDERAAKEEIAALEAELKALGVDVPAPDDAKWPARPYDGPHSSYLERGDELRDIESHHRRLRALVDDARARIVRRRRILRVGIGAVLVLGVGAAAIWAIRQRRHTPPGPQGSPLRLELMPARTPPDERDLRLMVSLALVIDREPAIEVVAGNGARLLHPGEARPAEASARTVCAISWRDGNRLEASLWPTGGTEYWRATFDRETGEDEIRLARRVAGAVAENLRRSTP